MLNILIVILLLMMTAAEAKKPVLLSKQEMKKATGAKVSTPGLGWINYGVSYYQDVFSAQHDYFLNDPNGRLLVQRWQEQKAHNTLSGNNELLMMYISPSYYASYKLSTGLANTSKFVANNKNEVLQWMGYAGEKTIKALYKPDNLLAGFAGAAGSRFTPSINKGLGTVSLGDPQGKLKSFMLGAGRETIRTGVEFAVKEPASCLINDLAGRQDFKSCIVERGKALANSDMAKLDIIAGGMARLEGYNVKSSVPGTQLRNTGELGLATKVGEKIEGFVQSLKGKGGPAAAPAGPTANNICPAPAPSGGGSSSKGTVAAVNSHLTKNSAAQQNMCVAPAPAPAVPSGTSKTAAPATTAAKYYDTEKQMCVAPPAKSTAGSSTGGSGAAGKTSGSTAAKTGGTTSPNPSAALVSKAVQSVVKAVPSSFRTTISTYINVARIVTGTRGK